MASPKGRRRSLVCSQKTGRKGPDAVRRSLPSGNYTTGVIYRQQGRSFITDRTRQHINSVVLQTAGHLKTKVEWTAQHRKQKTDSKGTM